MPTLAIARLWFEGNAFSPLPTGRAQFEAREWTRGAAALAAARDTATELAGVQDVLALHPQWHAELLRCASANQGGAIEHAVFEAWCDEVTADLDAGPILGQARIPILPGDTPDTLGARVLPLEHRLYPAVLRRFVAGDRTPLVMSP